MIIAGHHNSHLVLDDIGFNLREQDRLDKIEKHYIDELEYYELVIGEGHPETLEAVENLAEYYHLQGLYEEASALYLKALEIKEKMFGDYHPNLLEDLEVLAVLARKLGDDDGVNAFAFRKAYILQYSKL